MLSDGTVFAGGEISDPTRQMILEDLVTVEAGLISGETLGVPVYPVSGIELDYAMEHTRPAQSWHDHDKLDAADDWATARQFGTIPHIIRYRRSRLYKRVPDMIRADLAALESENAEQSARKEYWLSQIDRLTAPELATYLVYREFSKPTLGDPDIKPKSPKDLTNSDPQASVSFRFGQDDVQEGWYDESESFEIRTTQGSLALSAIRKAQITKALHRYANYYGFHLRVPNSQIHISYQTMEDGELTPIHDTQTPEGLELLRRATEGQIETVSTVMPSVGQLHFRNLEVGYTNKYDAGPDRFRAIRVMPTNFELRYGLGDQDITELTELALAAGFIAGVKGVTRDSKFNARIVNRQWFEPGEDYDKYRDVDMLRVLQVADFSTDGYAHVPVEYMKRHRSNTIAKYLLGIEDLGAEESDEWWFNTWADATEPVISLLQTIHVDGNGQLVCDPIKFGEWMLDSASTSTTMQQFLKASPDGLSASHITELLSRFNPVHINTIATEQQEITTDQLSWHGLVRKFAGSHALQACLSETTMERLTAELNQDFAEEEVLSAHFEKLLTDALEIFNILHSRDEGPTEEDYDRAVSYMIKMSLGLFDQITEGRPVDMIVINRRMIETIRKNMVVSKAEKSMIDSRDLYRQYVHEPRRRTLAKLLEIVETRQAGFEAAA